MRGGLEDYPAIKLTVPKENKLHIEALALFSEITWSSLSHPKGRLPVTVLKGQLSQMKPPVSCFSHRAKQIKKAK